MALTQDQIFQAADQLTAAGESPTLANVRKALGGGSFTTISEAMSEWKAQQEATRSPLREAAPEAITRRLHALGADIWAIALEMANARLSSERAALDTRRQQLEAGQQEATELADQLSAELDALQARYQAAVTELQAARTELEQTHQENADRLRQLATSEARAKEITQRADDLKAELQHAHSSQEAQQQRHRQEVQALKADLTTRAARLKAGSTEAARLAVELTQATAQVASCQQQQQRDTDEIQQIGARLEKVQGEKAQALEAAMTCREETARLRGELETLKTQNAALLAHLTPAAATPSP